MLPLGSMLMGVRWFIPHDFGNGRGQHVNISLKEDKSGECTPDTSLIACFQSTCKKLNKEELVAMSPALYWRLLEDNSKIHFGRYAMGS